MSSDDAQLTVLEKIERLIEDDEQDLFSKEEADALRQVARMVLALKAFGALGDMIRSILVWIGLIAAAFIAIKAGFFDFIRHFMGGNTP